MIVDELPEVSRSTLRRALEAGILAAAIAHPESVFAERDADRLRRVGEDASVVAIGMYAEIGNGFTVTCPVAAAFPDFRDLKWDLTFARVFDREIKVGLPSRVRGVRIVEDEA